MQRIVHTYVAKKGLGDIRVRKCACSAYIVPRVYKERGRVLNRVYTARNIRLEGSRPLK